MLEKESIFINRFLRHTRAVQDNMIFLEKNKEQLGFLELEDFVLFKRGLKHDIDKLEGDLIEHYITLAEYYNMPNTIDKDKVILAKQQTHFTYINQIRFQTIHIKMMSLCFIMFLYLLFC